MTSPTPRPMACDESWKTARSDHQSSNDSLHYAKEEHERKVRGLVMWKKRQWEKQVRPINIFSQAAQIRTIRDASTMNNKPALTPQNSSKVGFVLTHSFPWAQSSLFGNPFLVSLAHLLALSPSSILHPVLHGGKCVYLDRRAFAAIHLFHLFLCVAPADTNKSERERVSEKEEAPVATDDEWKQEKFLCKK